MEFIYSGEMHNVAAKLRKLQWYKFVDASGIQRDIDAGSKIAQQVRKAWELANPVTKFYPAARENMQEDSPLLNVKGE